VRYADAGLVLLGAYREDGLELTTSELEQVAAALGWRMARRESFANLEDAAAHARDLPESEEGYVVRFSGGARLKIKGSSYARLHAMIARVTPLGLWDAMSGGDDLDANRKAIPEEFWDDFDRIRALLEQALHALAADIAAAAGEVAHLSDKEVGSTLRRFPERVRRYIFLHRRDPDLLSDRRTRERLLRDIRPTGDLLPGYEPSFAIRRVAEDI
jgi:RNA ligase